MAFVVTHAPIRASRRTAAVVAALTLVGAAIFPFVWGSSFYGLVERMLLALATLWLVALALARFAVGRPQLSGHRGQ